MAATYRNKQLENFSDKAIEYRISKLTEVIEHINNSDVLGWWLTTESPDYWNGVYDNLKTLIDSLKAEKLRRKETGCEGKTVVIDGIEYELKKKGKK